MINKQLDRYFQNLCNLIINLKICSCAYVGDLICYIMFFIDSVQVMETRLGKFSSFDTSICVKYYYLTKYSQMFFINPVLES